MRNVYVMDLENDEPIYFTSSKKAIESALKEFGETMIPSGDKGCMWIPTRAYAQIRWIVKEEVR